MQKKSVIVEFIQHESTTKLIITKYMKLTDVQLRKLEVEKY